MKVLDKKLYEVFLSCKIPEDVARKEAMREGGGSAAEGAKNLTLQESGDSTSEISDAELQESLEDSFLLMGLSESEAKDAAKGRRGASVSTLKEVKLSPEKAKKVEMQASLKKSFLSMGLSESAANVAAVGR